MTDEELKKGIKVPQVNDSCIGCGACAAVCDDVFDMNDEGKAFVKEAKDSSNSDCIEDAI
jgi:ferredoxin